MTSTTGSARAAALRIERLTETVTIDGETVDLPHREFALLAALAARAGTAVHTKKLVTAIWPDTPGMTAQDVHVVMSSLRKRLGEADRKHKLIQNQPRFGYFLDLPPDQVLLADDLDQLPVEPVIHLDPPQEKPSPELEPPANPANAPELVAPVPHPVAVGRKRLIRSAVSIALVALAIGGSWSAGYLISSQRSQPNEEPNVAAKDTSEQPSSADRVRQPREPARKDRPDSPRKKKSRNATSGSVSGTTIAAPPAAQAPSNQPASDPAPQTVQQQPNKAPKPEPRPEPLPPAPTRYLYHLVNQESGDHFVTTDGNVASQYQARGYDGGAIGRIYTSAVEDTRAISTNQGTAYIFISSTPKTEPASRAAPLWYSTNNAGDFFYSTSEAEAKQAGWSASVVGYVGTL